MDVTFHHRMEEYYQRFIDLQEKLRKSEEERMKLEVKFNELLQKSREEEQAHYRKLRSQYKRFLDEDRKRQNRNEKILRALERIESRVNSLMSKTERFKVLRRQYKSYLDGISTRSKNNDRDSNVDFPTGKEESSNVNPQVQRNEFEEKNDKNKDEKMAILDRYLRNFRCKNLESKYHPPSTQHPHFGKDIEKMRTLDDLSKRLSQTFDSNKANSIAEDIMNSIYNRHYKKDVDPIESVQKQQPTYAEKPKVSYNDSDDEECGLDFRENTKMHPNRSNKYFQNGKNDKEPQIPGYQLNNDYNVRKPDILLKNEIINVTDEKNHTQPINKTIYKNSEQYSDKSLQDYTSNAPIFNDNSNGLQKRLDFELPDETFSEKSEPKHPSSPGSNNEDLVENEQIDILKINDNDDRQNEPVQLQTLNATTSVRYIDNNSSKADNQNEKQFNNENIQPIDEIIEPHFNGNENKVQQNHNDILQQYKPNDENDHTTTGNVNANVGKTKKQQQEINVQQLNEHYSENGGEITYERENNESIHQQYNENSQPVQQQYDENCQPVLYAQYSEQENQQYGDNGEQLQQQFVETGQPVFYHENGNAQPENQIYDEHGLPLLHQQYDEYGQTINQEYTENGHPIPARQLYDKNDQLANQQYDESGLQQHQQYDRNGHLVNQQYDKNSLPIMTHQQYDDNDQPITHQYEENSQQQYQQYDENVHLGHQHFDENSLPIMDHQQYYDNGQPITPQYDENSHQQYQQYDENGHLINQQYDESSLPISSHQQYDENDQLLNQQYDENGQPVLHQQYDDNGQPLYQQYDAKGYAIIQEYDENGQTINHQQYDENSQAIQAEQQAYDEYGQHLVQFDKDDLPVNQQYDGQPIIEPQYDENGQAVYQQYDDNGQPVAYPPSYDPNGYEQTQQQFDGKGNIQDDLENSTNLEADQPTGNEDADSILNDKFEERIEVPAEDIKKTNVLDLLDTDTESAKQNTSKISHDDSDFDFSNG